MTTGPGMHAELLPRARALEASRDFPALAGLLEPVEERLLRDEPELGYLLAYAWRRTGRTGDALALTLSLDAPVRRRGDGGLIRRIISLEAMLRYDLGELALAESLWERLGVEAEAAGDFSLSAAALNNLGVVRTLQDRTEEALASYNRALLACRRLGDRRGMAQAHQNMAILFREKGMQRESASNFDQAWDHARASESEDLLGRIEEERALLVLEEGDERLATAMAERALGRFEAIEDAAGTGEALRVLGIAALRRRDLASARAALETALARGEDAGGALLRAETLEALAVLEDLEERTGRSVVHREAATALFAEIGAGPWGARVRERTSEFAGL